MQILPSYATRPAADGAGAEKYQTLLGTEGDWTLECGVDITSTRGAVKNAEPQVLTLGESKLDLKKFSVSPLGAVAVVDEHFTGGIGEGDVVQRMAILHWNNTPCGTARETGCIGCARQAGPLVKSPCTSL
ncbi:MAG: hypothetical protein ACLRI7_09305 [Ruthenibacterium lactatiformans]